MSFHGPLADRYWAAVALVLLALTPFLALTSATAPLEEMIGHDVGLGESGLAVTTAMSDAAYCFGTVAAVQLTQKLPSRRPLVGFALLFLVASIMAAWAPTAAVFVVGRVLQGLATSLMLIAAAPPLIIGWPQGKLRISAITMNLGIFGAVALGPSIGGLFASWENWRLLSWLVAAAGAGTVLFSLLTFEDAPPQDPEAPVDVVSLVLAASGCGAAFYGASKLADHSFGSLLVLGPLLAGIGLLIALMVHQTTVKNPLMPVRRLAHTIPVAAIGIAMAAGAASVGLVELVQVSLGTQGVEPGEVALLFLPEFGGAILTAAVFGAIFFTRWVPAMAFAGIVVLAGAGAVLSGVATGALALVAVGSGVVGIGVGASVSPALFATGFSLPSRQLPRIFAMVELLRGAAAFLAAPLLLHVAATVGASPAAGVESGIWLATAIAAAGALFALAVFAAGGARLRRPDVGRWLEGGEPAYHSPPVGAAIAGWAEERATSRG